MLKFFPFVLILMIFIVHTVGLAQAGKAELDGSFITGDICGFWTDTEWQQEFSTLKEAGMHYLIIPQVAISSPGETTITLYPSGLPNTEMASYGGRPYEDVVDACLRNAESAGMKVFIGIDFNKKWWSTAANDSVWLFAQMEFDNDICDELWNNYKSKYPNAFYGWYWSYEVANPYIETADQQYVLTKAMNIQLDHLTEENKKMPFMWCPFMNSQYGTPQEYGTAWKNVFAGLHTTEGDIFCPQDCVGAGGLTMDEIEAWFSALRDAVDTKPGLVMWSDVETFKSYDNSFIASTIDRVVSQMQIEKPYADNYISWEYTFYYSPNKAHIGFHTTYVDYLVNDSLETSPPDSVPGFSADLLPDGSVSLNWDTPTDNIGICGYNIYRNGKKTIIRQVPVNNNNNTEAPTKALDTGTTPNTNYSYQIEAYDFAGNLSVLSAPLQVSVKNFEKLSLGCSYTVSTAPSEYYPDQNGKKLTDGQLASQAYYADPDWVGFVNIDSLIAIIDLEQIKDVQHFFTDYLLDPQPSVYLPREISVSISNDNNEYTNLGILRDISPNDTLASIHKYFLSLSAPLKARYVKFKTITSGRAWLFVDEYQILKDVTTAIKPQKRLNPSKFDLGDNYPNPFNPSTNIRFTLAESGNVSLKIYTIMGRLVKIIIDNIYMNKGKHKININLENFASNVYFYILQQGNHKIIKKMILLK